MRPNSNFSAAKKKKKKKKKFYLLVGLSICSPWTWRHCEEEATAMGRMVTYRGTDQKINVG
jgi:hypothetical protein